MKKLLLSAAALGLLILWACHLGPEDDKNVFEIEGDTSWTSCDSVLVELLDKDGNVLDTLFNDSLKNIDQLQHLSADKYPGGKAQIHIKGSKSGGVCFEQKRNFESGSSTVVVDTVADPGA